MIFKTWIDLVFPPLCLECEEETDLSFFCEKCWNCFSPLNPQDRCRHCFNDLEDHHALCLPCRHHHGQFPIPRGFVFEKHSVILHLWRKKEEYLKGFAAFLFLQWIKLSWPAPDLIIVFPEMKKIAPFFADLMQKPYFKISQKIDGQWVCDTDAIEENLILLFLEEGRSDEALHPAISLLSNTFPKRGYTLSLLYDPYIRSSSFNDDSVLGLSRS